MRSNSSKKISDKNGSYTEKYHDHIPCSFAYKVVCVDNKFSKDVVMYRRKIAAYKFIKAILKEYGYCKRIMKKHYNQNLVMFVDEEERFQLDLYLKTDYYDYYGLDPCHYFSSPGLSWDAMLKMTGVVLELISDIDTHLFIEKGMRSSTSYIAKRHSKTNNKYMKDYESDKEDEFIIYVDANNLYGWAMTQYLPYGGFKWLSKKEIDKFDLNLVKQNSSAGYILEVDLEYPCELHNFHNDYPLAPEKLEIRQDMLSKNCSDIADKYGIKSHGVNKLVPNLGNKKNMLFITKIFNCICH